MSSIKAILYIFISISISAQAFDEAELIRQTLAELELLKVPVKVDEAKVDEEIKSEVGRKFSSKIVDEIKANFIKTYPLYVKGVNIEYKTRALSFSGQLTSFDTKYFYVDRKRLHISKLPLSMQIRFEGKLRESELKKEIYKKFKRPAALFEMELREKHSKSSNYQKYIKHLNKKKVAYCVKEFDALFSAVRTSEDKKAVIRDLLAYYKGNKKYLSSRSSQASKAYAYYSKFDSNKLLKELAVALKNKETFDAEPLSKQKAISSIVLIEGDKGVGTGFFINFYGFKCVISNRHVFIGNKSVKITDTNNNNVPFEEMIVANPGENLGSNDVMIYTLSEETKALYSFIPVSGQFKVDMNTSVYGNSLGDRVVRSLPGKLRGVGPKVIEVDNEFVPGNSGSPIIQNGYVIGIATYAKVAPSDWTSKGAIFSKVRRFGVKLSAMEIDDFSTFSLKSYQKDLAVLKPLEFCVDKFIDSYKAASSKTVPIDSFILENKKWVALIQKYLPRARSHKFTKAMFAQAKSSVRLGNNILKTIDQLNLTSKMQQEQNEFAEQASKYQYFSVSADYYRSTAARKNFIRIQVRNYAGNKLNYLIVSLSAKNNRSEKVLLKDKRFKLYLSRSGIQSGSYLEYKISLPSTFPKSGRDVTFYGGVVDVVYK